MTRVDDYRAQLREAEEREDDFAELRRWANASLVEGRDDGDGEEALRKALSYGWSVAARPDPGRKLMERWIADGDGEWVQRQLPRI